MNRVSFVCLLSAVFSMTALVPSPALGDEPPVTEGGWLISKDDQTGITIRTMEMTLYPQPEPRPALKYRLLPDEFEMLDGNAALYYLKASGFFEQDPRRDRLREVQKSAREQAAKEGKSVFEVPPYVWLNMSPNELPLAKVRDFLRLTSFQPPLLREAAKRRRYDLDRNIREVEDLFGYLLPEVQSMREVARMQSLRCKVAIAEGRISDAFAILGQQYALGRHLGQDVFFISNLVGIACTGYAWDDALHLVQHPETPNLYWAFATLPRPLVDSRYSQSIERDSLYLQLRVLREVDETPRPPEYWQDFLDRLISQMSGFFANEFGLHWANADRETARSALVGIVAAAYPTAKRYLMEEWGFTPEQLAAYPTAQVVFLAMVRFHDDARDAFFKWTYLPFHQAHAFRKDADSNSSKQTQWTGYRELLANLWLSAMRPEGIFRGRLEQQLALLQAVEAIRMYGAAHEGKLPPSLDKLPVPVPPEPFTGQPLDYQYHSDHAILSGHPLMDSRYRLVLRFAE